MSFEFQVPDPRFKTRRGDSFLGRPFDPGAGQGREDRPAPGYGNSEKTGHYLVSILKVLEKNCPQESGLASEVVDRVLSTLREG